MKNRFSANVLLTSVLLISFSPIKAFADDWAAGFSGLNECFNAFINYPSQNTKIEVIDCPTAEDRACFVNNGKLYLVNPSGMKRFAYPPKHGILIEGHAPLKYIESRESSASQGGHPPLFKPVSIDDKLYSVESYWDKPALLGFDAGTRTPFYEVVQALIPSPGADFTQEMTKHDAVAKKFQSSSAACKVAITRFSEGNNDEAEQKKLYKFIQEKNCPHPPAEISIQNPERAEDALKSCRDAINGDAVLKESAHGKELVQRIEKSLAELPAMAKGIEQVEKKGVVVLKR